MVWLEEVSKPRLRIWHQVPSECRLHDKAYTHDKSRVYLKYHCPAGAEITRTVILPTIGRKTIYRLRVKPNGKLEEIEVSVARIP